MSSATITTKLISGEELAQMSGAALYELIDGVLVPMSPAGDDHGAYELNIGAELRAFVRSHGLGKVSVGEVGIYIRRNPDRIRAADALFISNERYAQRGDSAYLDVAPELVVEVQSPYDSYSELRRKLADYFSIGVRLVWVLDPATRSVLVHRSLSDVAEIGPDDVLTGDDVLPGFSVSVAKLFEI